MLRLNMLLSENVERLSYVKCGNFLVFNALLCKLIILFRLTKQINLIKEMPDAIVIQYRLSTISNLLIKFFNDRVCSK